MKTMPFYFLCLLILIGFGCKSTTPSEGNTKEVSVPPVVQSDLLSKVIEAHGGLATWYAYPGLSYNLEYARNNSSRVESFLLDLHSRHERIRGTNYVMAFDGKSYWQKLLDENARGKPVKFFINLQSYFFSMPFILSDPGINYEELGKEMVNGKEYLGLRCTFNPGIGVAPEDEYVLYINPETYRLEILLYTVTYFNADGKYRCGHYGEWQEINGLSVPKVITSYIWDAENKQFGEKGGTKTFFDVKFLTEPIDPISFAPLEGSIPGD